MTVRTAMIVWNTFVADARVRNEAKTLTEAGYQVDIYARMPKEGAPSKEELWPGATLHRFPRTPKYGSGEAFVVRGRRRWLWWMHAFTQVLVQLRVVLEIARSRPDVVHGHDVNTAIPAYLAAKLSRARFIYDAHEFSLDREGYGHRLKKIVGCIEGCLMPRADATICTTPALARVFARTYGVPRPIPLGNWPRTRPAGTASVNLREWTQTPSERPLVLYQGGLQPGRGLLRLVDAAARVPQVNLVLMGEGRLKEELQKRIDAHGEEVAKRIHLHPAVPLADLLDITATADIGVHPLQGGCLNHAYASPNKIFEYLHAGLPVVTSDLPEMRRIIGTETEDPPGVLAKESTEDLADTLLRLAQDPDRRSHLSIAANKAATRYCWEAQELILLGIYRNLLANKLCS